MNKADSVLLFALLSLSACSNQHETPIDQKTAVEQNASQRHFSTKATEQLATVSQAADDDTLTYSSDSLQYLALNSFELLTYRITPDTLQLVSTSAFLYYPFGKFTSIAGLQKNLPAVIFKRESDKNDVSAKIYRGVIGNAFVKMFFDQEKKSLEIVSGNIYTPELKLGNGIKIGMKKRAFFAKFFKKASTAEQGSKRIVELISGLDGIRHYYTFKNNVLAHIEFDTDYQFDKR